jgi:ABC-2 type transport system permease protein
VRSSAHSTRDVALAVAWRSIHNYLTNPALLLPSLIFPLFFFSAFAGGLSTIGKVPSFDFPTGYTAFQFVFVLLQSSAFGGVFTGFGIAMDFESGVARRLLLAAPRRGGIVLGYVLAGLLRAVLTWALLLAVALAAGMRIDGGGLDVFGLFALALLVNLAATLWACGVAMRIRSIQGGPAMQIPVFLVLFLAPVYVPLRLLSGWIHAVASVNPATALIQTGRGLIAGDPAHVALAFALGAGLLAAFSLWARRGLRRAEASS